MGRTFGVELSAEYFRKVGQKIDWDETGREDLISLEESDLIQNILTCEAAVHLLHNSNEFCGGQRDDMVGIRRRLINEYEEKYKKKYIEYNDFY